ncbi:MAG TPA: alcohol dehydrogenase catalytic domain-containing protein [Trueperaceae bacterium]|nr:alcohol dehydrogenase catalytic domain-containing protein [Trueperaceae bacterium]
MTKPRTAPLMLATRAHGPDDLRVERVPIPVPQDGDVLLRIAAAGICATDRKIAARGSASGEPLTLGHEIVGIANGSRRVVVAPNVGCGHCRACKRGQSNYCLEHEAFGIHVDGGMAEYLLVPERAVAAGHLLNLPDTLDTAQATLVEPIGCAVESLAACQLGPGESVLIIGDGVMGRLHVPLAKALGAGKVTLVGRHQARLRHAAALGADVCLDDADPHLELSLSDAHGGDGFDVIVVTIGQSLAVTRSQGHLAVGGRLNLFAGLPKTESTLAFDGNLVHYRNQSILGTTGASLSSLRKTIELLEEGRLVTEGLISSTFQLDEALDAFEAAGSVDQARVVLVAP